MAYTTIDKPEDFFSATLYTGDGSADQSMTGAGFKPDFLWIKRRNASERHVLTNVQMGVSDGAYKWLDSADAHAEFSGGTGVESFDSDGFTIKSSDATWNASGSTYVFWSWKANGGTTASNTDGTITSTVQANQDAGFSIVTYTGNGSSSQTVGHGLGVAPDFILVKSRNSVATTDANWIGYHKQLTASYKIQLNKNVAAGTSGNWSSTSPTTSVFSILSGNGGTNASGGNFVAYCFAEKQGYSKFGSYVGNGSTNGTFVYTGFKPAVVINKRTDGGGPWTIFDNARCPNNVNNAKLYPHASDAEVTTTGDPIDFLSNGYKLRGSGTDCNVSGGSYIYMAFAENPFTTSTGIPTTAR